MEQWLIQFGLHHQFLVYVPVTIVAILEGPILSMFFGVLLKLGYFSLIPVYASLMLGDLIGDVVWYYIGYHYGRSAIKRFGKKFNITEEGVERVEKRFHENKTKILFISKITNGFGLALVTLTTAGIVRIPFKRYITVNIVGQFIWSGTLLAVGYFFSDSYQHIGSVAGKVFLIVGFAAVFYGLYRYNKAIRTKLSA